MAPTIVGPLCAIDLAARPLHVPQSPSCSKDLHQVTNGSCTSEAFEGFPVAGRSTTPCRVEDTWDGRLCR